MVGPLFYSNLKLLGVSSECIKSSGQEALPCKAEMVWLPKSAWIVRTQGTESY